LELDRRTLSAVATIDGENVTAGSPPLRSPPVVSVIIANYNGRAHLERCLPALLATRGVAFEAIVVDNGSNDDSVAFIHESYPGVRVIALPRNVGFGRANHHGVAGARADHIAFLNNDTVVDPDWLLPLVETLRRASDVGAVCSTLRMLDRPDLINAYGGSMTWIAHGYDRQLQFPWGSSTRTSPADTEEVLFPTAAAMLMRRDEFESVGGFDPEFFAYHEDVDLGWRLWLYGKRVLVCHRSMVQHARGGSSARTDLRDRLGARHAVRSLIKNYGPAMLARSLLGLVRFWTKEHRLVTMTDVLTWNLVRLPSTLVLRRKVQARRVVPDHEMFRRGLLGGAWLPPTPPERPRRSREWGRDHWVESHRLRPGYDSALGRLGPGWYARERIDGRWARRTCGEARAWLRAQPHAHGRLVLRLHGLDRWRAAVPITIRCNGAEGTVIPAGNAGTRFALPVRADSDGLLEISVVSKTVVPHDVDGSSDWRVLGAGLSEIRFAPHVRGPRQEHRSVSVVIPTFNRWETLHRTLEGLAAQTGPDFEVIVVDDGSTDGTWQNLQSYAQHSAGRLALTVLRQENLKPALARNAAVRRARGDVVLFLGDDVIPDPLCLQHHVRRHNRNLSPSAVVGFVDWDRARMRTTPFLEFVNNQGPQFGFAHMLDGRELTYTCFYTSNVSVPRSLLDDPAFDPTFDCVGWEDTELGYRLSLRGVEMVHDRSASARHYHPQSVRGFYHRQARAGQNAHVLLALHSELRGTDPLFGPIPSWSGAADRLARMALPALDLVDRAGVALPGWLYWKIVNTAYFSGYRRGRSLPPALSGR
jgi:GT2 family glycosyltransferase